ncbi:MAG: hypothetical protein RJB34_673 [Pseudomonadota bacterium]
MYLTRNQAYGFRTEGSNPSLSANNVFFSVHWRSCESVLCCWYICWYVLRELFVYLPTTTFKMARWP